MDIKKLEQKLTKIGKKYHRKQIYIKQHPKILRNRKRMRCERKLNMLGRELDKNDRQISKLYQKAAKAKEQKPRVHANAYYKEITMHYKRREYLKRQCKALKAGTVTRFVTISHISITKSQFKLAKEKAEKKYKKKHGIVKRTKSNNGKKIINPDLKRFTKKQYKEFHQAFFRYHPFFKKNGKYYKSVGNIKQKIGHPEKHYHQESL